MMKMALCWRADYGPSFSFVIFQGIQTYIAKKPYIFVILGGSRPPAPTPPPNGYAHVPGAGTGVNIV